MISADKLELAAIQQEAAQCLLFDLQQFLIERRLKSLFCQAGFSLQIQITMQEMRIQLDVQSAGSCCAGNAEKSFIVFMKVIVE
jgi:hypothetical protein